MQRSLHIFATVVLLVLGVFLTKARAEEAAGPVGPELVSGPERWLNFQMTAPTPMAIRFDGRRILVKAGCETVLYDLDSGMRLHVWTERFSTAHFSGNGRFLLTVQDDQIRVWDAESFHEVRRFAGRPPAWNEPDYQADHTIAAISDDGGCVAIANRRSSFHRELPRAVLVYDTQSGDLRHTVATPEKIEVGSVEFLRNGRRLLVGYADWRSGQPRGLYSLWDMQKGVQVGEFPLGELCLASPDGRWIASRAVTLPFYFVSRLPPGSNEVTVWDSETGKAVRSLEHAGFIRDVTFSPDSGKILAALEKDGSADVNAGDGGRLVEWDVLSGKKLFEGDDSPKPYATVAYSPDGQRRFATTEEPDGVDDDVMRLLVGWDVTTGARLPIETFDFATYNGHEELFFYPKGDRFVDLAAAFAVREMLTGKTVQTLPEHRVATDQAAFTPDGEKFLAGLSGFMVASYLTDCVSGRQREWYLPGLGLDFVDRGRLLCTHHHAKMCLIDVVSNRIVLSLPVKGRYGPYCAAVSPDASRAVISVENDTSGQRSDPRMVVMDLSRLDRPRVMELYASAVAFRPDGERFLAASADAIEEFDAATGDRIRALWRMPGRTLAVAYGEDGSAVLACGVVGHRDRREPVGPEDQGWAMLWNERINRAISLEGHTAPVTAVAFGPGGTLVATASLDNTIRLWNTASGRALCVFQGHLGSIRRIAYSPRGDRILSAADDGSALWNVARFASPRVEPLKLAESFAPVERVNAVDASFGVSSEPTDQFLPRSDGYQPASMPGKGRAKWMVFQVGEIDRRQIPRGVRGWLSQARATVRLDAPPPIKSEGRSDREIQRHTSRDGRRQVSLSVAERQVNLRDADGRLLRSWDAGPGFIRIAISPSGKEVAVVRRTRNAEGSGGQLTVYDADSGSALRSIHKDDPRDIGSITIDPQERTFITSGGGKAVLRDYKTLEKIAVLGKGKGGAGPRMTYSPNGRFVASHTLPIRLYDPITLALVKTLPTPLRGRWFRFTPDETRVLAGQEFAEECQLLTMLDIDSGRPLWSRSGPSGPSGGPISFSPDGHRFLVSWTRSSLQLAVLWDATAGEVLCVLLAPNRSQTKPVFSRAGASVHLGTPDGPCLWPRD